MESELKEYMHIVKKRLWLILLIVLVISAATGAYSYLMVKPQYEANNKFIVTNNQIDPKTGLKSNDVDMGIRLVYTYKEIISTTAILEKVVAGYPQLHLSTSKLLNMIKVDTVNDTPVMTIAVRDYSYANAVKVANAVSEVFKSEVPRIVQAGKITILYETIDNPDPVNPSPMMYTIIAFIASLILSIGLAFLLEYLDDSIKTDRDVEAALGLTTLAMIKHIKPKDLRQKGSAKSNRKPAKDLSASLNR
ncbi:YveK family protein [Paenibacillus pini]|uniref:Tyrosine-protein kinase transmembrane modulator EpsC n=1 Tax=Paenibacillus pini JCM 16418 TaxID=1236976 RepID=W7YB70_9BACL|nr:Wzz/FepE/Etk N-terminal domain-containing protein [Paenibacillus pini]GAF08070.1 tyrosine-protein kinase transmembrane modulator EpsC [Paenibacillus pini JCM 16418]